MNPLPPLIIRIPNYLLHPQASSLQDEETSFPESETSLLDQQPVALLDKQPFPNSELLQDQQPFITEIEPPFSQVENDHAPVFKQAPPPHADNYYSPNNTAIYSQPKPPVVQPNTDWIEEFFENLPETIQVEVPKNWKK